MDRKQVRHQMHDHTVCFYLVGISDDQLRAANDHLGSSVRFMPLSAHGHAWSWNAHGPAQILTVICCGELHGRGIAKTSRETCVRNPIAGLRKFAAHFSGRPRDSFWFFCRQPCFWLLDAAIRKSRPPFRAPRLKEPPWFRKTSPSSANGMRGSTATY